MPLVFRHSYFCAGQLLFLALSLLGASRAVGDGASSQKNDSPTLAGVTDLSDRRVDPLAAGSSKALVFLFLSVDCPISNRYAPEFRRLNHDFSTSGVAFKAVYPNRQESNDAVRKHIQEYKIHFDALRDKDQSLTKASGAHVTPEAAVYIPGQGWIYHGRIDDRNVALGRERVVVSHHDLRDIVDAIVAGKALTPTSTPAIGCSISTHP